MSAVATLIGECNPYGGDQYYALYPAPDGCAGHRLATLILGMSRQKYLETFDRVNLLPCRWSIKDARKAVRLMADTAGDGQKFILLGSKVAAAFGLRFTPFSTGFFRCGTTMPAGTLHLLILPHPSGLCRMWNEPGAIERARVAVNDFLPEVKPCPQ